MFLAGRNSQETKVNPYSELDQLYTDVLRAAISRMDEHGGDVERIRQVFGIIGVLQALLPLADFATFVGLTENEVLIMLRHLHSTVVLPTNGSVKLSPHFFHRSFIDFITDMHRCTDFLVDANLDETRMCMQCLDIMMRSLKRDLLNLAGRNPRSIPRDELYVMVDRAFPPSLRYACEFWAVHLERITASDSVGTHAEIEELAKFAECHLLYWLEAMSVLGANDAAVTLTKKTSIWAVRMPTILNMSTLDGLILINKPR